MSTIQIGDWGERKWGWYIKVHNRIAFGHKLSILIDSFSVFVGQDKTQ